MNIETLHDLFLYELRGLYYVETTLVEALDRLADQAAIDSLDEAPDAELRDALREAFAAHRDETEAHVDRLERVFERIDRQPEARAVAPLDGLIEEKEQFSNVVLNDAMRLLFYLDAGLKAERLEIRIYESVAENAGKLGASDDVVEALEANLREERDALAELEELAESDAVESLRDGLGEESPEL